MSTARTTGRWIAGLGLGLSLALSGCFKSSSNSGGGGDDSGTPTSFAVLSGSSATGAFGSVPLGSKSAASTFTISNAGQSTSGPLATAITGPSAAAFVIDTDGCTGQSLPSGGTCGVTVHFAPTTAGAATATLAIDATPGGTVSIALAGTGESAGALSFSAMSVPFGTVVTGGGTTPTTLTLSNGGGSATGKVTIALGGPDAAQFATSNDGCSGKPLAPSATCTVDVQFAPTTPGSQTATLAASDPAGDEASVALSGTGAAPAALTVTPASHDFGSLTVGTPSSSQTFTVQNAGGVPSSAPQIAIAGANAADFAVTSSCSAGLGAGQTCTFGVIFTPSTPAAEGPATITASATGATSGTTSVTGTGLAPAAISVAPTSQAWGTFAWGTTSADTTFTVTNDGGVATGALTVALTGSGANQFALGTGGTCAGATLAANGGNCKVTAHFAPLSPATGAQQASLAVGGTPGGTVAVALSGTAAAPASLALDKGTYTLGPATIDTPSSTVTLTLSNTGGVASGVPGAPSITGTNAADFAVVSSTCTAALAPGDNCKLGVVFTPKTAAAESATFAIAASPGGTAQATLAGTGLTAPALAITPDPGNTFAATTVAQTSAAVTFTVTNSGQTASTALGVPAVTGANPGDFAVVAASDTCSGVALAANGGHCTFQVTFTPGAAGARSATVTAKDAGGDTASDPLSGTGLTPATLTITPDPGNTFAATTQGYTSAPVTFTVDNSGQTASSPLGAPTLTTGNAADFAVVAASDTCSGVALAASGGHCTFQVTFTPSTTSTESTTLGISDGAGHAASDPLTATGLTPVAQLTINPPSPVTFKATGLQGVPTTQTFTIQNVGTAPTTQILFQNFTAPFSNGGSQCPAALGVGASCTVTFDFTPGSAGPYSDTITVFDTASDSLPVVLSGAGVSSTYDVLVSPNPIAFNVAGGSVTAQTYTATNYGMTTIPIAINTTTFSAASADFTTNLGTCNGALLAELQSCTFTITFTAPTGSGSIGVLTPAHFVLYGQTDPYVTVPVTAMW
jgi:hypothetical protein